ncbi:hypothetical protein [Halobaculum gomorrense]|uniref:Uncharacterized protein n=1 Tax=Halobaculum gomorrense TaxID=43928 RepID=A0A1M5LU48_9EURY|nr:hypothetical protein [Halobaculum gomorrense]SHG68578.1 hypothetical protein SAMN05443636_0775 [Halobaculum gomorrense]
MPHKTGASHAIAALAAMVSASYLKDVLKHVVSARELVAYANAAGVHLVGQVGVASATDTIAGGAAAALLVALTFVWGWAYHHSVIG